MTEPFLPILTICKKTMLNHNSRITESFLPVSVVTITHLFANVNPVVQNNRNILTHLEFFHCPNIRGFFRNLTPGSEKDEKGKGGGFASWPVLRAVREGPCLSVQIRISSRSCGFCSMILSCVPPLRASVMTRLAKVIRGCFPRLE